MSENIQFLIFGIITFIFGISNAIPAWFRVYKTKNISSISFLTQIMRIFSSSIVVIALICTIIPRIGLDKIGDVNGNIWLICHILDLAVNIFGLFCASYIFALVIKNKNKKKITISKKNVYILIIFLILALSQLTIIIILRMQALDKNINDEWVSTTPFVFWIRFIGSIISVFTMLPLTLKIISTKNTYSISIIAECSLLIAMIFWTTYDCMEVFYAGIRESFSYIISDIYTSIWVLIIFIYKFKNLLIGKRKKGKWIDMSDKNFKI